MTRIKADNAHMKQRLNLTIDADLVRLARQVAHERQSSVSALIEKYLRNLPSRAPESGAAFVAKWTGRLRLAPPDGDARREYLWHKFRLEPLAVVLREADPPTAEASEEQQEPGCGS